MLQIGDQVPEFSLTSDGDKTVSNASLKGKRYVLYFYPKDDTPGCTTEACSFRDNLPAFDATLVKVFGVSADSSVAHDKFVKKFSLNFTLISDPSRVLIEGMGVWVDLYDDAAWKHPATAVADMAAHGVRTLYLETSNFNRPFPFADSAEKRTHPPPYHRAVPEHAERSAAVG